MKLLYIDQDAESANLLKQICEILNHDRQQSRKIEVVSMTSLAWGLNYLYNKDTHVILLDIFKDDLAGMEGLAVLKMLKASSWTVHIPICIVSVPEAGPAAEEVFAFGAEEYLQKPLQLESIDKFLKALGL